jgi:hypothetical protein
LPKHLKKVFAQKVSGLAIPLKRSGCPLALSPCPLNDDILRQTDGCFATWSYANHQATLRPQNGPENLTLATLRWN